VAYEQCDELTKHWRIKLRKAAVVAEISPNIMRKMTLLFNNTFTEFNFATVLRDRQQ